MQRIIQINLAGRITPIEEDAYHILKDYISSLEKLFASEEGRDEIIQDIEIRIAELFAMRLQNGAPAIDKEDVRKVMDTLGHAYDIGSDTATGPAYTNPNTPVKVTTQQKSNYQNNYNYRHYDNKSRRLFRNPNDKVIGGVCSGLGSYFDIDPVIIRLIFATCFLIAGIGLMVYIVAWIVIPVPRTPEEMRTMMGGEPMDFHTMSKNMADELQDLKGRAEQMSRELQDFFKKKK
jgi:phage shock protein C